jgi:hypothetical protein
LFDEEAYYTKVNAFALGQQQQGIGVYFFNIKLSPGPSFS